MADKLFDVIFRSQGHSNRPLKCIKDAKPLAEREQPQHYSAFFGFGVIVGFELIQDLCPGQEADAWIISLQDMRQKYVGKVYDPMGLGFQGPAGMKGYASPVYVQEFDLAPVGSPGYRRRLFYGESTTIDFNNFKYVIINMQCPPPDFSCES